MIAAQSTKMFAEAASTPEAVARQSKAAGEEIRSLARRLQLEPPGLVLTCARGSSDHAATFGKYLIEILLGVPVASAAPSTVSIYNVMPNLENHLWLCISQSGASPDLLAATKAARSTSARTVAITNNIASPLAEEVEFAIDLCAGPERSVAATKSYITSLVAVTHLVAEWKGDETLSDAIAALPDLLSEAWEQDWRQVIDGIRDADNLYVIGRGIGLGVANEAALKLKETCGLHAEGLSAAELKHGPLALVQRDFPVIVFRQADASSVETDKTVKHLTALGARVFVAGGECAGAIPLPSIKAHPVIEPILQILSFYRMANSLSIERGFHPDVPFNLSKVTETI